MGTPFRPEVLAPAGSPDCLPAAVAGGADAVYLGMRHFNARGRAENFRLADLPDHLAYLHHHGVKAYVVLNTLVHEDEHPKALRMAETAVEAGVDAAIIQDLGLWRLLGQHVPELERHASTQMTVHHPDQVRVLADLGATRVILARELSLDEVAACTEAAQDCGIETEHFVHGALCYAFSGQCLISNFSGCRSANRGTCAQNCRFDYQAPDESQTHTHLSMRDFSLVSKVQDLCRIGVASLKIEGRLKGPDYVYTVSRLYRAASEAAVAGRVFDRQQADDVLRDVFSRPFTTAPLDAVYGAASRFDRFEQDEQIDGRLHRVRRKDGTLQLESDLEPRSGQGYACTVGRYNDGFLITGVDGRDAAGHWRLRVRIGRKGPPIPDGTPCRRNSDHGRRQEAEQAMAAVPLSSVTLQRSVQLICTGTIGEALTVRAEDDRGRSAVVQDDQPLEGARQRGVDEKTVRRTLGAFGGSGYALADLDWQVAGSVFIPEKRLKSLRRQLVAALDEDRAQPLSYQPPASTEVQRRSTALWVAVDDVASAQAALEAGAEQVWLSDLVLDAWGPESPSLPDELTGTDRLWFRHPAVLATSPWLADIGLPVVAGQLGAIRAAQRAGLACVADQSMGVYSTPTMATLGDLGCQATLVSLELSAREVARLVSRSAGMALPRLGIVGHGRLPAMVTRQDHGLGTGASRRITAAEHDGGRSYDLQRRPGGWTALWEGRQLCAPEALLRTAGLVDGWVLELGGYGPDATAALVAAYRSLLSDEIDPSAVMAMAERFAPVGCFPGHLVTGSRALDELQEQQAFAGSANH